MRCPSCSFENQAGSRFCQSCGGQLILSCTHCGTQNDPSAKFCRQCGMKMASVETSAPAAVEKPGGLKQATPGLGLRPSAARLGGERKPVTILFTDIVGSTSMAEKLDPEEWREVVTGAHRIVGEAVRRYEGTIAQYLGDGVLAFFGAPVTHEDDPQRAVRAALDIQHRLEGYRAQLQGLVGDFQMRIGVNSGLVVVGAVGDDQHLEYLAIGDSVNLAARLQSACRPGGVLISAQTVHLLGGAFELEDLGEITVKGKAEQVHVYGALRPVTQFISGRGLAGLSSPLVGRDGELGALLSVLTRLEQGSGGIVFVLGEAGIGKSRLAEEVRRLSSSQVRWLEGRSLSYGGALSYWAISQLILDDLELSDGDPALRRRVALRRRAEALLPGKVEAYLPALEYLLGIREKGAAAQRMAELGGEAFKHQLLQAVGAYFLALTRQGLLALVLEDIHWADPSTLEVLEHLLGLTNRAPLLLLLVGRLDRAHGSWRLKFRAETDFAHRYREIQLQPLGEGDAAQLVDNLLVISELPGELRQLIVDRSDGNPFYLEELLRSLIEQGDLVQSDGRWRLARELVQLEIPETLQGVLLARLDRLEEEVRKTLQLASVIGRSFLYRLLEAISEAERELERHLDELQRVDLVREKARLPELEYIFKHSLTQEAAYQSLLVERRREFHRRVAQALERLFAGREAEYAGLLAHHYDLAGERDQALEYLISAGDQARLLNAFEEALRTYRRALELLEEVGDQERAAQTWLKLGLAHQTEFQFEASHQAFEKAFELKRQARRELKQPASYIQPAARPRILRVGFPGDLLPTLDPGRVDERKADLLASSLFAGLVEYDRETNILPHAARSWEVLDGGRRYLFHLREDVHWTDGSPVTAHDFEWAWKRNLAPGAPDYPASLLDDVLGARPYRLGQNPDSQSVGVRALDELTLEVRLESPVAYFIYLMANPVAFPLPAKAIERFGKDWWKPPHGVYNGAFRLLEVTSSGFRFARNLDDFGDFSGNLDGFEVDIYPSNDPALVTRFLEKELDLCNHVNLEGSPVTVPEALQINEQTLVMTTLVLNPSRPPFQDPRVRHGLAHGLDIKHINEHLYRGRQAHQAGGLVPIGMAGYSPELGLPFDLSLARRLLAEAGFPDGVGFPILKFGNCSIIHGLDEIFRQLEANLGIQAEEIRIPSSAEVALTQNLHLTFVSWVADYPDPDNFLRQSYSVLLPKEIGWAHPRFDQLVEEAGRSTDRLHRLALYREADRILVEEQTVIVPLSHGISFGAYLIHPWVEGFEPNLLGLFSLRHIRLEREG